MKRRAALPPAALPRQRGATLISLMVGLVISMLVTVATLMLYKNLVRATGDSRVNAQFDAQRSAALLMSGMTLQDAGFGIDDPQVDEHLITLKGATLGNAGALQGTPNDCDDKGDDCNATLWLQNMPKPDDPDAPWVTTCSALFSDQDKGGLAKLTAWSGSSPLEGCDLGNWASLTWKAEPLAGAAELRVAFTRQEDPCSPFGISAPASQALRLTLHASNLNEEVGNNVELESAHCLSNFSAPPAPSSPPAATPS